jgi:hypothetical protein
MPRLFINKLHSTRTDAIPPGVIFVNHSTFHQGKRVQFCGMCCMAHMEGKKQENFAEQIVANSRIM